MAIEIKIAGRDVERILEIVRELRRMGYQQPADFNFSWKPAQYDWLGSAEEPSSTTFIFYNNEAATFFRLKYD